MRDDSVWAPREEIEEIAGRQIGAVLGGWHDVASRIEGERNLDVAAEPVDPHELASEVAATILSRNLVENAVRYPGGRRVELKVDATQNDADEVDEPQSSPRTYRVVVCDDQPGYRRLVAMALALDGAIEVVAEAENGEQAITAVTEHRPDVLLLDVAMPVMDGLEALPQVVARSPDTKVVMLTGVINDDVRTRALGAGAVRFLEKGVDPAALVEEVKAAAAGGV